MRTKTLLPYAAGLAAALVLGGCAAGEPPPAGAATAATTSRRLPTGAPASSSATTTTTADPVLARIPKAARAQTRDGAMAFGQFYIESVAKAFVRADAALLDGLATTKCKTCSAFEQTARQFKKDGEHHARSTLVIERTSIYLYLEEEPVKRVGVHIRQIPVDIVDAHGAAVGRTKAATGTFVLTLEWNGRWVVDRAQVERF